MLLDILLMNILFYGSIQQQIKKKIVQQTLIKPQKLTEYHYKIYKNNI